MDGNDPIEYLVARLGQEENTQIGCSKSSSSKAAGRSATEAYAFASSLAAALLNGLFEHPARGSPIALDVWVIELPPYHNSFPAAC